jgi:hypothetical protein
MKRTSIFILLILALLVTACGSAVPADQATEPSSSNDVTPYPGPRYVAATTSTPWYPGPGTPGAPSNNSVMLSGYEPLASDVNLDRSEVFLDLPASDLIILESMPIQVIALLAGSLPDPCHQLRVVVTPPNADNRINLEVYSLTNRSGACTTVIQPFSARIPLGSYSAGHFSVYVNGELLGEFDA